MQRRLVGIRQAAEFLGVSVHTLRRWEREGRLQPDERTPGGWRRYDLTRLRPEGFRRLREQRRTLAYARVSSAEQQEELQQQSEQLERYCQAQGWSYELICEVGDGLHYQKRGLRRLLEALLREEVGRLVLTHKDRLLRFGAELVFAVCEARQVEVVILNQEPDPGFEEDLARDVEALAAVMAARLYGPRSPQGRWLLEAIQSLAHPRAENRKGVHADAED